MAALAARVVGINIILAPLLIVFQKMAFHSFNILGILLFDPGEVRIN